MPESDFQPWPIERLLASAHAGKIRVPEFQRPFDLKHDWVLSLLASVSLGYPIGALTLLEAGAGDLRFASRPIAGAPAPSASPEWFVVDGQQRLTTLCQVFGRSASSPWYVDVDAALDPATDRDQSVRSADETGQPGPGLFPLRLAFGEASELERWRTDFVNFANVGSLARFDSELLGPLTEYRIPIITLGKQTSRWTVRVHGGRHGRELSDRFRNAAE